MNLVLHNNFIQIWEEDKAFTGFNNIEGYNVKLLAHESLLVLNRILVQCYNKRGIKSMQSNLSTEINLVSSLGKKKKKKLFLTLLVMIFI